MRGRKNHHQEAEDHHRWVISYADFITLLFAFFVVMYAISSVNISKYKSLSEGMHSAFNMKDKNRAKQSTVHENDGPMDLRALGGDQNHFDAMNLALTELEDSDYHIAKEEGWIEIDMKAGGLFELGSAQLRPIAMIKLMQIAEVIKNKPYPVVVEGYTDNQPIETPQYPSNWELSAARAATVARTLNLFGVDSTRITVAGFGDQFPIADNMTEGGRIQNRRVNLVIARDKSIPRLMNPGLKAGGN